MTLLLPNSSPLIHGLGLDFLAQVRGQIGADPFVSETGRGLVERLLQRNASVGEVGDALFRANASGWFERTRGEFGDAAIRGGWYGAERVLRPFDAEVSQDRCSGEAIGEVLEVHCESGVLARDGMDAFTGGLSGIELGLRTHGYFGFSQSLYDFENGVVSDWITVRLVPPTVLQGYMDRFLGANAAHLCAAPAFVRPRQVSDLHKEKAHPVGYPTTVRDVHGFQTEPLGFILHDEGHSVFWSAFVAPDVRLGASLLYDSLEDAVPSPWPGSIAMDAAILLDLNQFLERGELSSIWDSLSQKLDAAVFANVRNAFDAKRATFALPVR